MHQVIIFFAVVAGRDDAPAVFAVERQRLFILHQAFQRAGGGEGGFRRLQQRTAGAARRLMGIDIQVMNEVVFAIDGDESQQRAAVFCYPNRFAQRRAVEIFQLIV